MRRDRTQVGEVRFGLLDLLRGGFEGALQLLIAFEVFLRVLAGGKRLVERDGDLPVAVVPVGADQFLCSRSGQVAVSFQEFAVPLELIALFRGLQLFFLQIQLPGGPLQGKLQNVPQVCRTLLDAGRGAFFGKKGFFDILLLDKLIKKIIIINGKIVKIY